MCRSYRKPLSVFCLLALPLCLILISPAYATFSIVAVDTATGAVGGAGASCIANCQIINDIIEGIGAVHTQAYYLAENQQNAHALLAAGATPDSIIHWLENNDFEASPYFRQYGVVTLAGPGASAGYTGAANSYWAGHLSGPGYAIQGNILLDGWILDSMLAAYQRTTGPLEDKLMAALEAANVPGADTRCFSCNKPSISAFVKVVRPGDGGTPYLYELVTNTVCAKNPIDSLRVRYDLWKGLQQADSLLSTVQVTPPGLPAGGSSIATIIVTPRNYQGQPPIYGAIVAISNTGAGVLSPVTDNGDGTFTATLTAPLSPSTDTIKVTVSAGNENVLLAQKPVVKYYLCGDANGSNGLSILDATFVIAYLFKNGPDPVPTAAADANGNGTVNILDATYLISHLFKSGPAPVCP